jgi:hypothetical protein
MLPDVFDNFVFLGSGSGDLGHGAGQMPEEIRTFGLTAGTSIGKRSCFRRTATISARIDRTNRRPNASSCCSAAA